jgi:hypothetical protein
MAQIALLHPVFDIHYGRALPCLMVAHSASVINLRSSSNSIGVICLEIVFKTDHSSAAIRALRGGII